MVKQRIKPKPHVIDHFLKINEKFRRNISSLRNGGGIPANTLLACSNSRGMPQLVKPLVWLNGTDTELAELKKRGVDHSERNKEAIILNSKASEDLFGKMTLLELWRPLEYN